MQQPRNERHRCTSLVETSLVEDYVPTPTTVRPHDSMALYRGCEGAWPQASQVFGSLRNQSAHTHQHARLRSSTNRRLRLARRYEYFTCQSPARRPGND